MLIKNIDEKGTLQHITSNKKLCFPQKKNRSNSQTLSDCDRMFKNSTSSRTQKGKREQSTIPSQNAILIDGFLKWENQ